MSSSPTPTSPLGTTTTTSAAPSTSTIVPPFIFSERVGLLFTVLGASLSIASAVFILGLAFRRWLRRRPNDGPRRSDATDSSLFLNLMFADLIQAIGAMFNLKWMSDALVADGTAICRAQGVIKQVGINGVALTSMAVAIHTFAVLIGRWEEPKHSQKYIVGIVWFCVALIVGISNAVHHDANFYANTQYWCWISKKYFIAQMAAEYAWVWLAALVMLFLYGTIFIVLRRTARKLEDLTRLTNDQFSTHAERTKAIAASLLFYPAVYIAYIAPNTIVRWMSLRNPNMKVQKYHHATFFANTIFALSGFFNLILFLLTRRDVVMGSKPKSTPASSPLDSSNATQNLPSPPSTSSRRPRYASPQEEVPLDQFPSGRTRHFNVESPLTIRSQSSWNTNPLPPTNAWDSRTPDSYFPPGPSTGGPGIRETPRAFDNTPGNDPFTPRPPGGRDRPRSQFSERSAVLSGKDNGSEDIHLP